MTSLKRIPEWDSADYADALSSPSQEHDDTASDYLGPALRNIDWNDYDDWDVVLQDADPLWSNDRVSEQDAIQTSGLDLYLNSDHVPATATNNGAASIKTWMTTVLEEQSQPSTTGGADNIVAQAPRVPSAFNLCYGMINRVTIQLVGDMSDISRILRSADVEHVRSYYLLDINLIDNKLYVTSPNGEPIAQVNKHFEDSLLESVKFQRIKLQALLHKTRVFEIIGHATRSKDANMNVNINVYGSVTNSQSLSQLLSVSKIWLQRPDWFDPQSDYQNPHVLKIPVGLFENEAQVSTNDVANPEEASLQESIAEVFSQLTRDANPGNMTGNERLSTNLLPHQEKALDFMIQRETGPIPPQYQQWTEVTGQDGSTWYQHKIAGLKSRTLPKETGGGVLADDMGMGKTLSLLALIVKSSEEAYSWSTDDTTRLDNEISSDKVLSPATLVVVPTPLLLNTWLAETRHHLRISLRTRIYHGNRQSIKIQDLTDCDLVLTTYQTLVSDTRKGSSLLQDVAWYRLVLDEAHIIRNQSTFFHKRVTQLQARYRWCLTGTPIQNSLDDIGALFTFLRIYPFDRLSTFRKCVTELWQSGGSRKVQAKQNLVQLIDSLCLRRLKDLLNLNYIEEQIRHVELSEDERMQYTHTKEDMKRAMHNNVDDYDTDNRFGMFQAQLQLRLLCNHGTFQHRFHWARARTLADCDCLIIQEDASALVGRNGDVMCSACFTTILSSDLESAYQFQRSCSHVLCTDCQLGNSVDCPLCEAASSHQKHDHKVKRARFDTTHQGYFRIDGHSSKLLALVDDLRTLGVSDKR
ncbi:hypothetical protein LTR51_005079 [Lithohypha guttulata]|uniref:Helicase ATP-binding domain-containing protein n=1 Tax=Lithohypha guttulata TaxID=1690604 RepID=A0AAN7T315_9EURO|nr:hypothetical protein LTR51_005079 [Lithohypha guttulata]KAK5087828.1 hypothetical protein LTR05_002043 [Lithohypha guttulata]